MTNQWILKKDDGNEDMYSDNFDDYGYGSEHRPSVGDEVETSESDSSQYGIVLDVIRNMYGEPVCYKVWRRDYESGEDSGCFDYIRADKIRLCEPCGSSEWSLGRIGYKLREEDGMRLLVNEKTEDVIMVW